MADESCEHEVWLEKRKIVVESCSILAAEILWSAPFCFFKHTAQARHKARSHASHARDKTRHDVIFHSESELTAKFQTCYWRVVKFVELHFRSFFPSSRSWKDKISSLSVSRLRQVKNMARGGGRGSRNMVYNGGHSKKLPLALLDDGMHKVPVIIFIRVDVTLYTHIEESIKW